MAKFNKVDDSIAVDHWGPFYTGAGARDLDAEESRFRQKISNGSMSRTRATTILDNLDPEKPFYSRVSTMPT